MTFWRGFLSCRYHSPLTFDPIARMQSEGCLYAYNWMRSDDWFVTKELWATYRAFAAESGLPSANLSRVERHVTKDGKYIDLMFETNFEIGALSMFRDPHYQVFPMFSTTHHFSVQANTLQRMDCGTNPPSVHLWRKAAIPQTVVSNRSSFTLTSLLRPRGKGLR